jgi:hypothetical protein
MTSLAEKQKQSIDNLQNDQIDLAKVKSFEQHASSPLFTYTEEVDEGTLIGAAYAKSMEDGNEFDAANFRITQNGEMYWSVDQTTADGETMKPNAVSLVLAREDGTVEQLDNNDTAGWVDDLAPKDVLYVLPRAACEIASSSALLTKEGLDQLARAKDHELDVVRVSLDQSTELESTAAPVVVAPVVTPKTVNDNRRNVQQRKQNEKRQKKEAAAANAVNPQSSAPVSKLKARMDLVAARDAATDPAAVNVDALPIAPVAPAVVSAPASSVIKRSGETTPPRSEKARGWSVEQTAAMDKIRARREAANGDTSTRPLSVTPEARNTSDSSDNQETEPVDPELKRARDELDDSRTKMAALAAKRQGRLFNFANKNHSKVEEEYKQRLEALGKLECSGLLNDDTKSDKEKNIGVIGFIFDQQQKLREETIEGLKNTPVSKMINWLHTGSKKQQLLKAVAVGAGGVLLGAGVGAVAGVAAGGGLVAAAAVTKMAVRFGRYYAREENKQGRGMNLLDTDQAKDAQKGARQALKGSDEEDKFSIASDHYKEIFDTDTRREQEKRRKSAKRAIGAVALGMVVGGTAAYAIGELVDGGKLGDLSNRFIGGENAGATSGSGQIDVHHDVGQMNASPNAADHTDGFQDIPKPVEHDFAPSAKTIDLGEGWLQTFNEAGIANVNEQYALLNNQALMQELANKGLAYRDVNIGGWGINMTADGKMPADALKLITDFARRDGYDLAS